MKKLRDKFTETSWDASTARVETPKPAGLQAWENYKASNFQRIVNPTNGLDAWKAYKLNSAIKQKQEPKEIRRNSLNDNSAAYQMLKDRAESEKKRQSLPLSQQMGIVMSNPDLKTDVSAAAKAIAGTPAQDAYNDYLKQLTDYSSYLKATDFAQYSRQGAGIQNPSFSDAQGEAYIFGWRPGAEKVGNIVTFSRDNIKEIQKRLASDDKSEFIGNALYGYMTEDEVSIYNYLLAKEGKESAQRYLDSIEQTLNARYGQKVAGDVEKTKGTILYPAMVAGTATSAGLDQWAGGVKQAFNEYELPTNAIQYAGQEVRAQQGVAGKLAYDAINTLSNMAPSILASYVAAGLGAPAAVAEWGAAASLGLGSGGNAYKHALAEGRSKDEAKTVAALTGASEAVLSKMLSGIGAFGGITPEKLLPKVAAIENAIWRVAAAGGVKVGGEVTEELAQLYLEPLYKTLIYGDEYDIPTLEEVAYTTLLTIVTTGLLEGGDIAKFRTRDGAYNAAGIKHPGKMQEEAQSASVVDSAARDIQTQGQDEKMNTAADFGVAGGDTQVDVVKSLQDQVIEATVRAGQENQRQKAAAKTGAETETDKRQNALIDIMFGRNKKAVSEVDTAAKAQNADSAVMRQQIDDAYESGELTEAEYDDALDALMEQESLEGVNTLDRYNPVMMEKMEVNDNGRSSIPDEGGQRPESTSAGEQAGELAEGTGGNQSRTVQSQRAGDRADRVIRFYESEGQQPVTARSYLGSEKVEDAGRIYDVPQSVIDSDAELSEIAADIRGRGLVPHLFTGEARLANGAVADAMIRDNHVYIRVDSPEWTATQNWEHEKFHGVIGKSREMLEDLFVRMTEKMKPEKLRQTIRRYREAYRGIVDLDANGNPITGEELNYNVVEEILADAYAGKDTFAQEVEQFSEISQDAVSQIEERGHETRGPPEGAFSANEQEQKNAAQKGGNGSFYTYEHLVSKPDLRITEVPVKEIPTKGKKLDTGVIAEEGRRHSGLLYDDTSLGKQRYVYIPDINANVLLGKRGLVHGIIGNKTNSGTQNTAAVTYRLPEILRNSIAVNEENPRSEADGDFGYILFGYARRSDGQEYIVKTTINHFVDNKSIVDSVEIYDVLKGSKAKKVGTEVMSSHTGEPAALLSNASVPTTISVSDMLEVVKENYPELLSDSVRAALKVDNAPKQENLRFSASETPVETEAPEDPVQALPKKAQRVLEREEGKLTSALGNALHIPFKSRGDQLQGIAREITTEFLQTGNVSEKMLDDLFERAYRPNEQKLAEEIGVGVEEYREDIERDFKASANDLIAQLRLANRYAADQTADGKSTGKPVPALEDLPKLYADMKAARRTADKAVARNLLTESDNAKVNRLLRGDIDETMLNPLTDNVQGILEVFHAKEEYEKFAREIRRWNAKRKEDLHALADKLLETAGEWKDKAAGILYSRETMERNIRDIVKDKKVADEVINTLFKPIHEAAAKANTMKNEYRDRVRALNLSRKVASGNKISEAAAVQLLGEAEDNIRYLQKNKFIKERDGKTLEDWNGIVRDLWENNPKLDTAKIRNAVNEFREIYDELFEQMNDARMRNGYEPINYRKGYFPHFQSDSGDGILAQFGRSLGINTAALQLPTTINGMTHTFKPGIQWFGSAQQRQGVNTSFDAVEGFDSYIEGVADVIHQTDNIQRLRAFATQVRYRTSDDGLRKQVDAVRNDPTIVEEDKQNRIKEIYENGKFELGNFAVELDEYTNLLAGKKSRHDRDMEQKLGRRSYTIMKAMESRVAANMVAINPGSWLTNFIPITQGAATLDSRSLLTGIWDTLRAYVNDDGMVAHSSFLTNRRGSDPIVRTWAQETSATLSKPMELIDSFTADTLVRARYNQNIRRGMSEEAAIADADSWAAGVMADRSKGAMPTLFSQTNPVTKLFTQFQLEVNNQLSFAFKDIPREMKEKGAAALAMALLKFMLGAYLYNEVYEKFIGRRPALDPLGIINDTAGDLTGYELGNLLDDGLKLVEVEKKGLYDAGLSLGKTVAEELPFVGGLLGGGRLPIGSALPDFGKLWQAASDDSWDGKKRLATAAKELAKPAAYILPPFGGGQIKKATEGAEAVIRGGSYSVDSSGADILQYPVANDTFGQAGLNAITAMFFGKSALPEAREWVESDFDSLSAKQTALFDVLRDGGTSTDDAYSLIRDVEVAGSSLNKIAEIANSNLDESLKIIAMSNVMSESQYEKYQAASSAGVSSADYAALLEEIDQNKQARGSKSTSQDDVRVALKKSNLTKRQKDAIWESYGWKTESLW